MATRRFYNAGDKIDEILAYSIPTGQDVHCVARFPLICPKEDFFEVPTTMEITQTGESLSVQFTKDVTRKFGHRGVIAIEPGYDAEKEDADADLEKYPFASNDRDAMVRGSELWQRYLKKVVGAHLNDCESARAAGGSPRSAQGFTKRAMKLLKIQDPGEQYFNSLQNGGAGGRPQGQTDPAIAGLQAQLANMQTVMMLVLSGKVTDPAEIIKALQSTPNVVGLKENGEVATSGIATGQIKKPMDNVSGVDHELPQHKGKKERTKDAEKALGSE